MSPLMAGCSKVKIIREEWGPPHEEGEVLISLLESLILLAYSHCDSRVFCLCAGRLHQKIVETALSVLKALPQLAKKEKPELVGGRGVFTNSQWDVGASSAETGGLDFGRD